MVNFTDTAAFAADASPANDSVSVCELALDANASFAVATPAEFVFTVADLPASLNVIAFPANAAPDAFVSLADTVATSPYCDVVLPVFTIFDAGKGVAVGDADGAPDGVADGVEDGVADGDADGEPDGLADGVAVTTGAPGTTSAQEVP
jgi:hypothetical protein